MTGSGADTPIVAAAPKGADQNPRAIREMFAAISPTYDKLNHLFSGALDRHWRAVLARELTGGLAPCRRVLDVATGTGDVARAIRKRAPGARVIGVDFTRPMLALADKKFGREEFRWIEGDGLRLPFADGAFDAASIAFGLRNMQDRMAGLRELRRVVRPGGRIAVLEFSQPKGAVMRRLYDFYSFAVMPRVGRWISRSDAYLYLPSSIREFWTREELARRMEETGLGGVQIRQMMGGVVCLHVGEAAGSAG